MALYILPLILISFFAYLIYERFIPVKGVKCVNICEMTGHPIVDVRDYNHHGALTVQDSYHIPFGYLHRYYPEIPEKQVFIVAESSLEKNLSIRLLKRKGFKIAGVYVTNQKKCNQKRDVLWDTCKM
ncbi:hypothetical protein [Metabacillus arenae]|uniref:Sulfurtransferase n=1 Tax=Metabacillus arenae TaxID=2771434 RepID=A0A926NM89_9BACI|nr:hypothetical protein [Metabacillus arenae]MBD1380406.1 hypothetical protein [Metabacillus arenae]